MALLPETIRYLRAWMMSDEHVDHPYPNDQEKAKIIADTGITSKQLTCWMSNNRKRYWKPKMEEMGRHKVVAAAMGNTLSPQVIEYLKTWMMSVEHIQNPYPTEEDKAEIMAATGIDKKQLTCWFSNNRKRFWKPKMDALRKQFGLSQSDPLPAALLATAAAPAPSPNEIHHGDTFASVADFSLETLYAPTLPLETSHSVSLDTSYVPAALPFETSTESSGEPVAAQLLSSLPLEEFSTDTYGSIDTSADEIISNDNKRQKLSSGDVVAV